MRASAVLVGKSGYDNWNNVPCYKNCKPDFDLQSEESLPFINEPNNFLTKTNTETL